MSTGRPGLPSLKLPHMSMHTGCPTGDLTVHSRSPNVLPLLLQDATAAYCIAIAWLINHSGDAGGAVTAAEGWALQNANEEVQGWLREAADPGDGPSCLHMIGFVRWGFVHSFRQVLPMLADVPGLRCEGSLGCAAVPSPFWSQCSPMAGSLQLYVLCAPFVTALTAWLTRPCEGNSSRHSAALLKRVWGALTAGTKQSQDRFPTAF